VLVSEAFWKVFFHDTPHLISSQTITKLWLALVQQRMSFRPYGLRYRTRPLGPLGGDRTLLCLSARTTDMISISWVYTLDNRSREFSTSATLWHLVFYCYIVGFVPPVRRDGNDLNVGNRGGESCCMRSHRSRPQGINTLCSSLSAKMCIC
jgi:hypothetical protein